MRFLILTIAVVFLGALAGCKCTTGGGRFAHSHGICDCEPDDYCSSRTPWIRTNMSLAPPIEPVPAPTKLPDGKKKL